MSKEEAWQELKWAWDSQHQNMHGGDCKCDKLFKEIKKVLNV